MKKILLFVVAMSVLAAGIPAQTMEARFDGAKMRERVKRLSADDFEGRGPGNAGSKKAADYIAAQMKAAGIKPGNGKSYFQNVKLVGVKVDPATQLTVSRGGTTKNFKFGDDFVATTGAQRSNVSVDADVVFMGYGVDAPLYKWNDYSGPAEDYRGKVLMIMVNDPPATVEEPNLFGGKALTYYGRWTYK
ncbi:MAG TPA: hypothetical protein PKE66_11610, partial [Pyrinomonadaceae bacterium]|nr:hypothetical protein [Pyrinomonadaceae bacterium]